MLRYDLPWFDSVFGLLLLRVFFRVSRETELNKIIEFKYLLA
jgi:hypothetical protein